MAKIEISQDRCKGCCLCTIVCPKQLLALGAEINRQGYHFATISELEKCTGCTICAQICPDVAIDVWK